MPKQPAASSRRDEDGFVYRGDPNLIHIKDGERRYAGRAIAEATDELMRDWANYLLKGRYTDTQLRDAALCPGCYMPVIFNAAVELAKQNGQDLRELGATMSLAFKGLAELGLGQDGIEDIAVVEAGLRDWEGH